MCVCVYVYVYIYSGVARIFRLGVTNIPLMASAGA